MNAALNSVVFGALPTIDGFVPADKLTEGATAIGAIMATCVGLFFLFLSARKAMKWGNKVLG